MQNSSSRLTLQEILRYCPDRSSPYREYAWRQFNQRYGKFIHASVRKSCRAWHAHRLHMQLAEVVADIVGQVFYELCKEEGKALRGFKGGDNEQIFLGWLATICHRVSHRYLIGRWLQGRNMEDHENAAAAPLRFEELDRDLVWEIYEQVVSTLRNSGKRQTEIRERNIHIFVLFIFGGFSQEMIRALRCFQGLGARVVEVEVNRIREELRNNEDFLR